MSQQTHHQPVQVRGHKNELLATNCLRLDQFDYDRCGVGLLTRLVGLFRSAIFTPKQDGKRKASRLDYVNLLATRSTNTNKLL